MESGSEVMPKKSEYSPGLSIEILRFVKKSYTNDKCPIVKTMNFDCQ
jgi:hypothetical protein